MKTKSSSKAKKKSKRAMDRNNSVERTTAERPKHYGMKRVRLPRKK